MKHRTKTCRHATNIHTQKTYAFNTNTCMQINKKSKLGTCTYSRGTQEDVLVCVQGSVGQLALYPVETLVPSEGILGPAG